MNAYLNKKQTLRQQKQAVQKWFIGTSFRVSLVGFIAVFGLLYLVQTNTVSTKGFEIADLQKTIRTLEHDTTRLEVEIAKHRSMSSIQERLQGSDLVAVGNVQYVTAVGTAVARR